VQDTPPGICPKFANDLASHGVGKDVSSVQGILQKSFDDLNIWSEKWDMTLNVSKTKCMLFRKIQGKLSLMIRNQQIEQVDCFKYLGVWLNIHMKFMQQAEYAASKASKAACECKVNRLIDGRDGVSLKTGIELYKTLVRPCWEFSVASWATMPESGVSLLVKVQARCLRKILGAKCHASGDAVDVIAGVTPVRLRSATLFP